MIVMSVGTEDGFADSFIPSPEKKKQSHQGTSLIQVMRWIWFKCAAASNANSLNSTIFPQEPMVHC